MEIEYELEEEGKRIEVTVSADGEEFNYHIPKRTLNGMSPERARKEIEASVRGIVERRISTQNTPDLDDIGRGRKLNVELDKD